MTAQCPSCGGRQDANLLCDRCTQQLRRDLAEVPALIEDLAIAVTKQAHLSTSERGSKGNAHQRWAIDVDASAATWDFETVLIRWAASIAQILRYNAPAYRNALAAATLIHDEMPTVRSHQDVAALTAQIHAAVDAAHEFVLGPLNRTRIPVGPCPELNLDGSHCDGQVVAYIPRQDDKPSRMQCRLNAEHKWTSIQFYRAGRRIHYRAEQLRADTA